MSWVTSKVGFFKFYKVLLISKNVFEVKFEALVRVIDIFKH